MLATGWETAVFYALGAWALVAGLFVATARKGRHGAVALVCAFLAVAGLFVLLGAELVAGVQVLVFAAGAAVPLVLAAALADGAREGRVAPRRPARRAIAAAVVVVLLGGPFLVAIDLAGPAFPAADSRTAASVSRNTEEIAEELCGRSALAFEIAGALLLVAIVGAVMLARERNHERVSD